MKKTHLSTIAKYIFPTFLIILCYFNHKSISIIAIELVELMCIFTLSNILVLKEKIGYIFNSLLLLLFNIQIVVLYFGNTYISMIMLSNLHSLEDIMGKAPIYIMGIVFVLVFSFLPIKEIKLQRPVLTILLLCFYTVELILMSMTNKSYSPLYSYYEIAGQYYRTQQMNTSIKNAISSNTAEQNNENTNIFFKKGITDYREKDSNLCEQPNIILFFTEGLSQNIIDDERNIMPNIAKYQKKSLSFDNYYNHTAATYRGITGQLYSGYQLNDFDTNNLISIQSILSDNGYNTFFFNVEPHNPDFKSHLSNFEFDYLLIDETYEVNGVAQTISDKDAYSIVYDNAIEQIELKEPFFMAIYTFGTHASFDSVDKKFGDGSDPELNKFHNLDYQFGTFMNKFENSKLADNTIIIFTTDHATYQDDSFVNSFPDYPRAYTFCDEIPLVIYYKGIQPETIDVKGRNTLGLAPTILDYLDISAPNYFLGSSLFSPEANSSYETYFTETFVYLNTKEGIIRNLDDNERNVFLNDLQEYFYIKSIPIE